ncbi:conserved hypothetical protein [Candidatus Terasakiella magnetica]|nr:conserved hypothetical protein [Candidatus Terasakiella magnetica]
MILSTTDIVMTAIGILAVAGIFISISAWRHVIRAEREADKAAEEGLTSAV